MRLDEPFGEQQIRLGGKPVDDARAAGRQHADVREHRRIVAVVHIDLFVLHDVFAEFGDKLIARGFAVAARGDQDGDVRRRIAAPHLGKHLRDDNL